MRRAGASLVPAAAREATERATAGAKAAAAAVAVQAILVLLRRLAEGVLRLAAIGDAAARAAAKEQQHEEDDEAPEDDLGEAPAAERGRQRVALQGGALCGGEAKRLQDGVGGERLARRPDDLARALARGLLAVEAFLRRDAGADVVGVGRALVALEPPVELAEDVGDPADVVVELAVEDALVADRVAEGVGRAGDRRAPA